jgi:hypothetical protein
VRIDVSQNGAVVNSVHPGLPAAEADGSVRVLSGIPFSGFGSGMYEVTVTAAQGRATARRTVVIEVQ